MIFWAMMLHSSKISWMEVRWFDKSIFTFSRNMQLSWENQIKCVRPTNGNEALGFRWISTKSRNFPLLDSSEARATQLWASPRRVSGGELVAAAAVVIAGRRWWSSVREESWCQRADQRRQQRRRSHQLAVSSPTCKSTTTKLPHNHYKRNLQPKS